MTVQGWLQIAFYSVALLLVTKPLGAYMLKVYDGSLTWLRPVERVFYRRGSIRPRRPAQPLRARPGTLPGGGGNPSTSAPERPASRSSTPRSSPTRRAPHRSRAHRVRSGASGRPHSAVAGPGTSRGRRAARSIRARAPRKESAGAETG